MQQAVAPCPEIIMSIKGKSTRSLLDSGSEVTLVNESYYREHIEHRLLPSSGSYNNSHNLFSLRGVEEGHVPLSKHFECDIEVGGQLVHRVGILVKKDKIPLVDSKGRKAKTPVTGAVVSSATLSFSFSTLRPKWVVSPSVVPRRVWRRWTRGGYPIIRVLLVVCILTTLHLGRDDRGKENTVSPP